MFYQINIIQESKYALAILHKKCYNNDDVS